MTFDHARCQKVRHFNHIMNNNDPVIQRSSTNFSAVVCATDERSTVCSATKPRSRRQIACNSCGKKLTMISVILQRDVAQYIAHPWLMT